MTTEISDHLTRFVAELHRQEAALKTVKNYKSDLSGFIRWFEGSNGKAFATADMTPTDIREYRSHLQVVQGCKPSTVNRRLAALRRFCQWALATKLISEDPASAVKGVPSVPRGPKSLEKRDVEKLVKQAEREKSKRDLAILQVLRHTGVRVGELCALRLSDVQISERKGSLTVRSGKGSKHRVIPLNNDARRAIEAYKEVRPAVEDDHLFVGQRREPLRPQGIELIVAKYARLAGLEGVTPHVLRHSFAKQVLDAGTDLVAVAALLGHQRIETTAIYTKPNEHDLERAVERLETR